MRHVKAIPETDLDPFATIFANAYPAIPLVVEEERQRFMKRLALTFENSRQCLYGAYEGNRLLGGMMLYDFEMTVYGYRMRAGGVGQLAVNLVNKKEKVARDLMIFFLKHYRQKGVPILLLYPFRPDFYKQMGFGYGTKMNRYKFHPAALPRDESKRSIRFLEMADIQAMLSCYNRLTAATHGMIIRHEQDIRRFFEMHNLKIVGFESNERLTGYLVFDFEKGSTFLQNDLRIIELVFENVPALRGLLSFLHTQFDQVDWIILDTHDAMFHHILGDPRNDTRNLFPSVYHESNQQGVGLMYRIIDVPGFILSLDSHHFGRENCRLKLTIEDSFWPTNSGSTFVHFSAGRPSLANGEQHDVSVRMDISDFSSLIMGVISFKKLYDYGLIDLADAGYVELLNRLFKANSTPVCLTRF